MARVTVVNDNPDFLELVKEILEDDRYTATTIDGDRPDALDAIVDSRPDLLMIDIRLGVVGDRGWQIARKVRRRPEFAGLPLLLCCSDPAALREIASELDTARPVETLTKPFRIEELTDAVDRLLAEPVR
jgi:CheY-like chemotaxis protein